MGDLKRNREGAKDAKGTGDPDFLIGGSNDVAVPAPLCEPDYVIAFALSRLRG